MTRGDDRFEERQHEVSEIMSRLSGVFSPVDVNTITAIITNRLGYVTFSERHALAYEFLEWADKRFGNASRWAAARQRQVEILDAKLDHLRLEIDGYLDSLDEHVTQEDYGKALAKLRLILTTDVVARPILAEAELNEHRQAQSREETRDRKDPD